ncbi:type II toxin-antitoxin system VapC family toxin [Xanthobacter sediminis]|uniref:type II toxin-antitoxin system VapC family toxin n=1 Tax=Xanthobacter sediminis TaxID=3119926 RepID=UPI0037264E9F
MKLLLDTNVLSEVTKPAPNAGVLTWLDTLDEDRAFISVVSIAEVRRGVVLLAEGRRRDALTEWLLHDLPGRFGQRSLPVDEPVALAWGDLMGLAKRQGRGLSAMDGLIAATALAKGLVLATRNMRDFESLGVELLDPWSIGT